MYVITGCTVESQWCGTYQRVAANCTDSEAENCPPDTSGHVDPTLCDGVPVYQMDDPAKEFPPVLYRYYDSDFDSTRWYVGSESEIDHLATCNGIGWSCSGNALISDAVPGRPDSNEGPPDIFNWGHECAAGRPNDGLQVVGVVESDRVATRGGH